LALDKEDEDNDDYEVTEQDAEGNTLLKKRKRTSAGAGAGAKKRRSESGEGGSAADSGNISNSTFNSGASSIVPLTPGGSSSFLEKYLTSASCDGGQCCNKANASVEEEVDGCGEIEILNRRTESEKLRELKNANTAVEQEQKKKQKFTKGVQFETEGWVVEATSRLKTVELQLIDNVKGADNGPRNLTDQFHSLSGLSMVVHREFSTLRRARTELVKLMETLEPVPIAEKVHEMASCGTCRTLFHDEKVATGGGSGGAAVAAGRKKTKPCAFCVARCAFLDRFTPEDAIGSHACSLEASRRVTNDIPLRCPHFLPVHPVNCVQTLKATDMFIVYEPLLFSHSTITKGEFASATVDDDAMGTNAGGGGSSASGAVKDLQGEYFYLKKGDVTNVSQQGPSELERLLRSLASEYKRSVSVGSDMNEAITGFFSHLVVLKREFFAMRTLWQALYDRVSCLDELAMCAQRISLKSADQQVSEAEKYGYGARFPTEIYTRGCHWIPRMFA
jgi:hypothetical protein